MSLANGYDCAGFRLDSRQIGSRLPPISWKLSLTHELALAYAY